MQRRKRRDGVKEAFWRGQVERHTRSGLGVRAFCRQQGLAENSFYAWRKELASRDREQTAASATAAEKRAVAVPQVVAPHSAAFAEVLVTASAEPLATAPIEIILASQRRIAIAPGFDPATLAAVLDVLEQRPC